MRCKAFHVFCILLACVLLVTCTQGPWAPVVKSEPLAAAEAGEEFAKVVNLMVEGSFTGDDRGIREYLDNGAYGGEVKQLLVQDGLGPDLPQPKYFWLFPRLPKFDQAAYAHGDVLLSRDICSWASNLLAWLLQSRYTHCGVLDKKLFEAARKTGADPRDIGCILSATLNDEVSGVTYETWRDWSTASTVTQMRVIDLYKPVLDSLPLGAISTLFNDATTEYSFLNVDPNTQLLVPVPANPEPTASWPPTTHAGKWGAFSGYALAYTADPYLWYCSKTTWFIYKAVGVDIENNQLIDTLGEAKVLKSGFYQLYKLLFSEALAYSFCYFASDMCVWPDEIRWAPTLTKGATWGINIE